MNIQWLIDNFPVLSGVAVSFLSFLSSFGEYLRERGYKNRGIKRIVSYAETLAVLPEGKVKNNILNLLDIETNRLIEQNTRKVNVANIAALVFVSVVGGGLSYLLALWATNITGLFSILAWLLFAVVVFFTLGISLAGLGSIYEKPKVGKKSES